jgi:hypothetical protein
VFYEDQYKDFEADFKPDVWDQYYIKFPVMLGICFAIMPLCLLKDISKMRIASLFSIASLVYAIFVNILK